MSEWFSFIRAFRGLPAGAAEELREAGFVCIPGPVAPARLARLATSYDAAVASADADEVAVGSSTTRVHGLVNRGPRFDELYLYPPILEACCQVIGRPFKLSTLLVPTNNGLPPAKAGLGLVAEARNCDIVRAVENSVFVIRADVAGRTEDLVSYGASGIVSPDGMVLQAARLLGPDLVVAEIKTEPRKDRRGWDASRNRAVMDAYVSLVSGGASPEGARGRENSTAPQEDRNPFARLWCIMK